MARFAIRDIVCPDGHVEKNAYCEKDDDGFPVYPACTYVTGASHDASNIGMSFNLMDFEMFRCGKPTKEWYGDGAAPAVHTFQPITYGGVEYRTEAEWKAYLRSIAEHQMVPLDRVVVRGDDPKERKREGEEAAHRGWLERKRRGIDDAQLRDHQREQKRETGRVFGPRGR
jgi:hypothetical protein